MDEHSRLPCLVDVIPLPPWLKVVSPGDARILLGIAGVVVEGALKAGRFRLSPRQAALRVLAFFLLVLGLLALRS